MSVITSAAAGAAVMDAEENLARCSS